MPTTLDHERERVVEALATHYAYDRLSLEAFEERLERAYQASALPQLAVLVADLPAVAPHELAAAGASGAARAASGTASGARPVAPAGHASNDRAPATDVPERGFAAAVMGGVERKGVWVVPRHFKVYAVAGGAAIDLREARFGPGVTEIEVFALMGGVELLMPPDVRLECSGAAFAGGFEADTDMGWPSPTAPVLRLSGIAIFGGVEAQTRLPGESGRDYKRRRREERRRRRGG